MWETDMGFDLHYWGHDVTIAPLGRAVLECENLANIGLTIYPTQGVLVCGRSGMQLEYGIITTVGCVDQGYKGNIKVGFFNSSQSHYTVKYGDRVAQLVIVQLAQFVNRQQARQDNGFGSSGK